jgi:hypothetical protein
LFIKLPDLAFNFGTWHIRLSDGRAGCTRNANKTRN